MTVSSTFSLPRFTTTRTSSLSPDVNDPAIRSVTYDQLVAAYYEQASALVEGNPAAADFDRAEPLLRAAIIGAGLGDKLPVTRGMIHLAAVHELVDDEVIDHVRPHAAHQVVIDEHAESEAATLSLARDLREDRQHVEARIGELLDLHRPIVTCTSIGARYPSRRIV